MIFKKKAKKEKPKHKKKSDATVKRNYRQFFTLYLDKAGMEISMSELKQRLIYVTLGVSALIWLYLVISAVLEGLFSFFYLAVQVLVVFPALVISVGVVSLILLVVYIDLLIYRRKTAIENVLPDFLQLASANIRSGMTIDRALWTAIRPQFGVLAKEVEMVAKQTMSGEDLDKALIGFAQKYDSAQLTRTVHLIVEGVKAGGELGSLLERISLNLQKSQAMQQEMAANVTSYVMFITFATVIAAPVLYGLSLTLIDVTGNIMGNMDMTGSQSGSMPISIGGGTSISRSDFIKFAVTSITITCTLSGAIISMIKKGNIKSGLKSVPVYIVIGIIAFFLSGWFLGKMFSGIF